MAITNTSATNFSEYLLLNTDLDETDDENMTNSSPTIYSLIAGNAHGSTDAYLKIYNTQEAVTVGTTVPDIIIRVDGDSNVLHTWTIIEGIALTGLSVAAVQEAGTAGTSAPAGTVQLFAIYKQ